MEIEKKMLKPNSHKRLRLDEFSSYWSDLPLDLLINVFERLGFADFQRSKSVCSSWHSASKQSLPNNQIPWLILFPEEQDNNNTCTLFNLEESKFYQTQDLGVEFTKSLCLATCGNWFFMRDPGYNLFILNLLTKERINLPKAELLIGTVKIRRDINDMFHIQSSVLWIDENTKDYAVCVIYIECVVYFRKRDQFWNQIPGISYCDHMVYKDHKLYISIHSILRILDFSGGGEVPPQLIYEDTLSDYPDFVLEHQIFETRLVVTLTGDVLRVNRVLNYTWPVTWSFHVYKIYSSSSGVLIKKPEKVVSLGDEAIVFDLGITVFGNDDLGGFRRNSIYFVPEYVVNKKIVRANMYDTFLFDIEKKIENFDISTELPKARWFLPYFKHT